MSVQTSALINGVWTTRRLGMDEVLARNQEGANQKVTPKKSRGPLTALLSRTIVRGPTIQWVLPARIRHQNKNDIVFVGEDFIQLKELGGNGHLEDVIIKSDFNAKIIGAKVIGSCHEISLEMQMKYGAGGGMDTGADSEQKGCRQILVLFMSTREMVFLHGKEDDLGHIELVHVRRPLPADVSSLEQYGRHLAIDPRSRAMATSASQKYFGVFSLKSPATIQSEMEHGATNPIKAERFFRTDGDIMAMEFLYPPAGGEDRLILLMLISTPGETHLVCYDWDSSDDFRIPPRIIAHTLSKDLPLPSVVIPLTKMTSFVLVFPKIMMLYRNITSPNAASKPIGLPLGDPEPKTTGAPLAWTAWARPMRNWSRHQKFDDIYLCREDGCILYLEIPQEGNMSRRTEPGTLGCNVDTAFAIIDGGYEAGDLLVAAGSMGDGGLFIEDARKSPRCVQKIPNWAPILDSVIIEASRPHHRVRSTDGSNQTVGFSYDRFFACTENGDGKGSITELRHGIEAQLGLVIDQEDTANILDIWTLPDTSTGGTLFLFSNALSSYLISVPLDATEDLYAVDEEASGLDCCSQTLAAGITPEQVMIQITDTSLHLSVLEDQSLRYSTKCEGTGERIIVGTVHGKLSMFAVGIVNGDNIRVDLRKVSIEDGLIQLSSIGEPLSLTYEPLCLAIEQLGSLLAFFIGTSEGKVLVSKVDNDRGLVPLFEKDIVFSPDNGEPKACECIRVISTLKHGRPTYSLFCGLRNGSMVPFEMEVDEAARSIELQQGTPWKLGDTPVRIRGYDSDKSFAIISCGKGLWRLSPAEDEDSKQHVLESVWITDQNNPARMQSSIDIFTCIDEPPSPTPGGLGGSLVCITDNQLQACTLEKVPKTIPRHIRLPGSPRKLMYSKYLKKLVVAYDTVSTEVGVEGIKRHIRPCIDFVDPDCQSVRSPPIYQGSEPGPSAQPEAQTQNPTGASGEIIKCMLDWNVTSGQKDYHMIVLGTYMPYAEHHGRVIYITARANAQDTEKVDTTVKYVHTYKEAIRSIAAFGTDSLVLAVGNEIVVQTLDASRHWRKLPGYPVESGPVSLSVQGSFIYVLTTRHALIILKFANNALTFHGQSKVDRERLDLFKFQNGSGTIMTSHMGGSIVGQNEKSIEQDDRTILPIFAAHLPHSVRQVNRSFRPPNGTSSQLFYGTALNGTVYHLTTLGAKEYRLLRFIQNLCLKSPVICPFGKRKRNSLDEFDVSITRPESLHLNGDILSRVTTRGLRCLRDLIGVDDMSAADRNPRMEKFVEYATAVVGESEDIFPAVMAWMNNLLRITY